MSRRLWIALIIIAGAVIAVVVLLAIETLLIDWDSFAAAGGHRPVTRTRLGKSACARPEVAKRSTGWLRSD
jgi:hypothetical protein